MDFEWLPDVTAWTPVDWGAAGGIGTLVVAAVATFIARRQLIQARELREEEAAPAVVVDIVPNEGASHILDLVIENVGKTVARNVKITFDPPLESATDMRGFDLAEWMPIREGIKTLVPGRRIKAMFDESVDRYNSDLPRQYDVTVECSDWRGRPMQKQQFTLDMTPLYGAMNVQLRGMHQLVDEVKKLREAVEPITKKGVTVEVYDGIKLREERAERHTEQLRHIEALEQRQAAARAADQDGTTPAEPPSQS